MKKILDRGLAVSVLLCLLPTVAGLLLYNRLPEQVAIHFQADGTPDNFVPRAIAVFLLPVLLALLQIVVYTVQTHDPSRQNAARMLSLMGKWIVPAIALFAQAATLWYAVVGEMNISMYVHLGIGLMLLVCGNYLPKCRQNYTVGIKLPWTLASADNWNRTHRLGGYIWIIGGFLFALNSFWQWIWADIVLIVLLALIPTVYSFLLYRKEGS